MRKILIPLALLPLLAVTGPLLAHDHVKEGEKTTCEHKKHYQKSGHSHKLLGELNLTDAQQTQIKDLKKAYWQDNRDAMKAGWQMRKEMMQLSYAESVDQAKLDNLIAESSEAYADKLANKAALNSAVFNVLTAEQQQQLQQKMAAYQAKHEAHKSN
ncbi:MAG TPA: Spy/CpxP family protein refolding chaperone [Methylophaga sp.]|nr:Spy/CpxP family protein refolding chaperone [Methylophaga sp.]